MPDVEDQREVLKAVATSLKGAALPFALAGGYAVWARGGPESTHDVDFVIRPDDAEACRSTLIGDGLDEADYTEDWLTKVQSRGVVVDLIHRLPTGDVDDDLLARTDYLPVQSVRMPVMSATDLLLCRMLSMTEHACDFSQMLMFARTLREQVDWRHVARKSADHPFGATFLDLLCRLGIVDGAEIRAETEATEREQSA